MGLMTLIKLPYWIFMGIICLFMFVVGSFLANFHTMLIDNRLNWYARINWYMFSNPPTHCQDCGELLTECGYNPRYECRKCNKEWCSVAKM